MEADRRLGDFVVREKLGEGAFGVVHRAEQPVLARDAVVKILHARHHGSDAARQRFLREARLASRLSHPLAAHVYAFGAEDDGTLWIAMELVRGIPLSDLLERGGPLPVDKLVPLFEQVCDVVHSAHEQGIVHRDLKPANIMVTPRGDRLVPKLLDFGLARLVEDARAEGDGGATDAAASPGLTQAGARIGSPLYMAPEQWQKDATVDARADQYALALVAYECLTGRAPFAGTIVEVGRAHLGLPLPPLPAGLPSAVDAVLARGAAKAREDRYPSVVDLAGALRAAAGMGGDEEPLPSLDDAMRAAVDEAPQPIAESIGALAAARNPHQALEAVRVAEQATLRYLAAIALAARTRAGAPGDPPPALRALRQRNLEREEWLGLIHDAVAPLAAETYPVPELAKLFGAGVPAELGGGSAVESSADVQVREVLRRAHADLAALVRAVAFLRDYRLVVPRPDGAEVWMGQRRVRRAVVTPPGGPLPEGRPVVLDREGRPLLLLWPLLQAAAPAPGAAEELFLFAGPGRHGARLTAPPLGFERNDDEVWTFLREILEEPRAAAALAADAAPYAGLAAYTREDADRFLGREAETVAFLNRLRVQPLLAVAGPSGSGKSSFVQAGVVPSLPPDWRVVIVRPGPDPIATLAARLCRDLSLAAPAAELAARIRAVPETLGDVLAASGPALLVVDQLEELFTLTADAAERQRYADALVRAAAEPVRVVLTIRDDFLARANQLPAFTHRLAPALVLVATPEPAELLRIIVEPARRAGYELEDRELGAEMVRDVAGHPGALALLSFTAAKLWEQRDRHFRRLTRAAYAALGGVGGALARHAEETLAGFTPTEKRQAREVFRRLITVEGTRGVLTRAEVVQVAGGDAVLEKLLAARLLTASDEGNVEIVHEALIAAWPRLDEWRREDAEGAKLRAELRAAARTWDERARPRDYLWRGEALAEYRRWRSRSPSPLTDLETAFASASVADDARGRRVRGLIAVVAIAVLSAAVAVLIVLNQRAVRSAREARERLLDSWLEQGRELMVAGDPLRGLVYLIEAVRAGADGPAQRFLIGRGLRALDAQIAELPNGSAVSSVGVSADGQRIITTGQDGKVTIWNPRGVALLRLRAHEGWAWAAELSPDGQRLATAGFDKAAKVWDAATGRLLLTLPHEDRVYAARFSPDGARLATASWDKTVKVWDATTGALLHTLPHDARVDLAEWSRDGARILSGGHDGVAVLWDAASGQPLHRLVGPAGRLTTAVLDGDGAVAITAGGSDRAVTWDTATGTRLAELVHPQAVHSADLSGDGTRAVTASADGTARVWDARTGALLHALVGHTGAVWRVRFCAGDSAIVTASFDATLRRWASATGRLLASYAGKERLWHVACDDSGRILASASFDHDTAWVWDTTASQLVGALPGGAGITLVTVSPDGRLALVSRRDGAVETWDLAHGARVGAVRAEAQVSSAVYSPDGRLVVDTVTDQAYARVRDAASGQILRTLTGHAGRVTYAEFSPDGQRIVTSSGDRTARVWNVADGSPVLMLAGHGDEVMGAAYRPDGARIVTASLDRTARIWDAATGALVRELSGHHHHVYTAFYSGDGHRVVTASGDRTARIWDADTGELLASLEGHTDALSWASFSPDGNLVVSVGFDEAVNLWNARSGRLLQTVRPHTGTVVNAVFTPDGQRLVSAGFEDGRVLVWDVGLDRHDVDGLGALAACRLPFRLVGSELRPVPDAERRARCAAP